MRRGEKPTMKYIYVFICALVFLVDFGMNNQKFFPNLPTGQFKVVYKAITRCHVKASNDIQLNLYLSKKSANTTEIRGNLTLIMPLDDSWTVNVNFAVKDSVGGWKDNAYVYKSEKACTMASNIFGEAWRSGLTAFGVKHTDCPVPSGVYVGLGRYELTNIVSNSNLPKIFFYGTYKVRVFITDQHNIEHGCLSIVIEIKRPWETD